MRYNDWRAGLTLELPVPLTALINGHFLTCLTVVVIYLQVQEGIKG